MAALGETEDNGRMSKLLFRLLVRKTTGTQDLLTVTRKMWLAMEYNENSNNNCTHATTYCGSRMEGVDMRGSDVDIMQTDRNVVVLYQGQIIPIDYKHKTVLYMREAGCRPGYATLQLGKIGERITKMLNESIVPVGDIAYISSDIYREQQVRYVATDTGMATESHGPCVTRIEDEKKIDYVFGFECGSFPKDASEWIHRTRLYGWPSRALIDTIVHNGCHLVPIGDTCSGNTLLQWRISLVSAERRLIHSLTHLQFQVYILLKYFLKQIQDLLAKKVGDRDILCSYFMKTLIFFAVENTHEMFWQEKNFVHCFWFCFNILITWVKLSYCPNYFFITNNMFQKKVHGQNQRILLHILDQCHQMKLMCLSAGIFFEPSIIEYIGRDDVQTELETPQTLQNIEHENDVEMLKIFKVFRSNFVHEDTIVGSVTLLSKSESEVDEVVSYFNTVCRLSTLATDLYTNHELHTGNKGRYKSIRKCKHWIMPVSCFGTELLYLATFYFRTGNYQKSLEMCRDVMSLKTFDIDDETSVPPEKQFTNAHAYCGQGYSMLDRLKKIFTSYLYFKDNHFCLPHLQPELSKLYCFLIPPLPYAVFLSFLCCHEVGDTTGRDSALRNLISVKYDDLQGGRNNWIVHTLIGISYETLGDTRRAIRAYMESYRTKSAYHELNPAMERIKSLVQNLFFHHHNVV